MFVPITLHVGCSLKPCDVSPIGQAQFRATFQHLKRVQQPARQTLCRATRRCNAPRKSHSIIAMNAVTDLADTLQEITKSMTWTKKDLPDLEGVTILVTGATDGVGFESARAFAEKGAHVVCHGRDRAKGDEAVAEIQKSASPKAKVELMLGDLSDFK